MGYTTRKWIKYRAGRTAEIICTCIPVLRPERALEQPLLEGELNGGRFLLVVLDHLGDAIMATVLPDAIKGAFPSARVDIVTRPMNVAVFRSNPNVDTVITDDCPWWSKRPIIAALRPQYFARLIKNIRRLRKEKYDVIMDLRGDLRNIILFGSFVRPKILLANNRTGGERLVSLHIPYIMNMNEVEKKLRLLEPLGVRPVATRPKIWLKSYELDKAQQVIGERNVQPPVVLVDPGAKPVQRWPLDRFALLIKQLYQSSNNPVLISAGREYRKMAVSLAQMCGNEACRILPEMGIREFMAVVAKCDLVVSADTGIVHVAGAVGTKVLTLFGPTNPVRFWHGIEGSVILASAMACPMKELHETCGRSPKQFPGACMRNISVEEVASVALKQQYSSLRQRTL
jgi:ADP-heptose:LPS heptosyltransferase